MRRWLQLFDALLRCFPLAFSQLFLRAAAFLPREAIARPPALPFHFDAADRCDNGALEVFQPRASGPRLYESTRSSRGRNTAEITQRDSWNCEGHLSNRSRNCHSLMGTAIRASGSSFQRQTLRPEASEIRLSDR